MLRRTGSWALGALLLLAAGTARAADSAEFYAQVDRDRIAADETVNLEVTLTTNENREPERVVLPAGPDFDVVSQNRADQMSFALGGGGPSFRRQRVYTLVLHPRHQGRLTINPGYVIVDGKRTDTGRLEVEVGPPGSGQPPQARRAPSPFGMPSLPGLADEDPFDDFFGGGKTTPPSERDVAIRATVDRTDPWVGQQVTLTLQLVSRQPISGIQNLDEPQLDAFWSEDLERPGQLAAQQRLIDGVAYFSYLIRRRALFPLHDGDLTIPPIGVTLVTGASFFGNGVTVERKTQPVTLHVRPLPPGAPARFVPGNVGHYTLTASMPTAAAGVGDPVTVDLTVEGTGNLRQLKIPDLPQVDGLRAYEPTHKDDLAAQASRWGGKKTLETVLVPERAGSFTVPSVQLPVFDPDTGAYAMLESTTVSFQVSPRQDGGTVAAGPGAPAARPGQADGLREIRPPTALGGPPRPLAERPWFWPALAVPALVLLGSVAMPRLARVRRRPRDARRTAGKEARRRLAAAQQLAETGDGKFWAELDRALQAYLAVRLGRPTVGLTRDDLDAALLAAGAPQAALEAVRAALDACDAGRFARATLDARAAESALASAATAIDDLETGPRGLAA